MEIDKDLDLFYPVILPEYPPQFPNPLQGPESGLIAIGGKIDIEWLLFAYENGIFPWYTDGEPIMWWSPDPRAIMRPQDIRIHKSMRPILNQQKFTLKIDTAFEQVITYCQQVQRKDQQGTWLNDELKQAFIKLHKLGYAHSFEAWQNDKLVGGLYGIAIGKIFSGESMFHLVPNASKFALIMLAKVLQKLNFWIIDCQISTPHLKFMGCKEIPRYDFYEIIEANKTQHTIRGNWSKFAELIK